MDCAIAGLVSFLFSAPGKGGLRKGHVCRKRVQVKEETPRKVHSPS